MVGCQGLETSISDDYSRDEVSRADSKQQASGISKCIWGPQAQTIITDALHAGNNGLVKGAKHFHGIDTLNPPSTTKVLQLVNS